MHAVVRSILCPDLPLGLDGYQPRDAESFGVGVQALIGPSSGPGEESFQFTVCTPRWLSEQSAGAIRWGHGLLIVPRWDADRVRRAIEDLCIGASGSGWSEVANKLNRFMSWEFEGYRGEFDATI